MATISGYEGRIDISGDGGQSWHKIPHITSAEESYETDTADESTWDHKGFKNEVPNITNASMSVEGFFDSAAITHKMLKKHSWNKQKLRVKFWQDERVTEQYYEFNAYVSSYSSTSEVEGKINFSAELTVEGSSIKSRI